MNNGGKRERDVYKGRCALTRLSAAPGRRAVTQPSVAIAGSERASRKSTREG